MSTGEREMDLSDPRIRDKKGTTMFQLLRAENAMTAEVCRIAEKSRRICPIAPCARARSPIRRVLPLRRFMAAICRGKGAGCV